MVSLVNTDGSGWLIPVRGPRLWRRFTQLGVGLYLFGAGIALILQSDLGAPAWDVLHTGLAAQLGFTVGTWTVIVSGIVLLLWIPLREPYGVGTLLNGLLIGPSVDITLGFTEPPDTLIGDLIFLVGGIVLVGFASGMYIGAGLGPGPRDGLMTGIAKRGMTIRRARTFVEVGALLAGVALGGEIGWGTLAFAVGIGPVVQVFLPRWTVSLEREPEDPRLPPQAPADDW